MIGFIHFGNCTIDFIRKQVSANAQDSKAGLRSSFSLGFSSLKTESESLRKGMQVTGNFEWSSKTVQVLGCYFNGEEQLGVLARLFCLSAMPDCQILQFPVARIMADRV